MGDLDKIAQKNGNVQKEELGEGCTATAFFLVLLIGLIIWFIIVIAPDEQTIYEKNQESIDSLQNEINSLKEELDTNNTDSLEERIIELEKEQKNDK